MQLISLTLILLLTACIFDIKTKSQHDHERVASTFFELQVLYHLAFEKHAYIRLEELYDLDKKTSRALRNNVIPSDNVEQVKKWHHKLRSYIVFLLTMQPTDKDGIIKTKMSSLLLHQLRRELPDQIDLSYPNQDFYRQVRDGKIATTNASEKGRRKFFAKFLATVLTVTEQTMRKYESLFAFEPKTFAKLCYTAKYDDCSKLKAQHVIETDNKTADRDEVTAIVNITINRLNIVIAKLQRLELAKPSYVRTGQIEHYDAQVNSQHQKYELILLAAAKKGILPIFFTDIFKKTSGNIHLNNSKESQRAHNKLLTEVTSSTVKQAVVEIKKELLVYWTEVKKLQQHQHKTSEENIYLWLRNSEIAVARLLLQNPEHAPVVSYLFHKYEHKVNERKFQKVIEVVLTTIGIGTLALFVTSFTPLLPVNAALSKAIIISATANFGWIGLRAEESVVTHNRHLMLERSLISGTSQQINENMRVLQEFEAARKNAILSSTIGLSMTATSYNQILKSLNSSSRPFLSNYIKDLFAPKTHANEPPPIIIDP